MKKKVILVLIILIPSLIYFLFELTEANFTKMAYYGPKTTNSQGDTVYYTLPPEAFKLGRVSLNETADSLGAKTSKLTFEQNNTIAEGKGAFIILFVRNEEKLNGILEYAQYKKEKLDEISICIVRDSLSPSGTDAVKVLNTMPGLLQLQTDPYEGTFDAVKKHYFLAKPAHVFDYFAVLVDKEKHIRGYYDATFISEVKRMIEEYKHLVLKDEHAGMQDVNKIEQNKTE